MSKETESRIDVIKLRVESLKANRDFFSILFTIESVILGLFIKYLASLSVESAISIAFLFSSVALTLYGVFSLTDSLHFYTKYLEYLFAWDDEVHGKAYPEEDKKQKATTDGQRALESDDVGYYFLKLSFLSFLYFLASLVLIIQGVPTVERYVLFSFLIVVFTCVMIATYKATHHKKFQRAFVDFFKRHPVISTRNNDKKKVLPGSTMHIK